MYNVLVVDDEKAIRENLKKAIPFEDYGFRVVQTAKNGAEAMDILGDISIDLIFLDINMPVMDGLSFLESLRNGPYKETTVVMLSGYNEFKYAQKAIRHDVKAYLTKPIDEDEAVKILEEVRGTLIKAEHYCSVQDLTTDVAYFKRLYSGAKLDPTYLKDYVLLYCVVMEERLDNVGHYPGEIIDNVLELELGACHYGLIRSRGSILTYLVSKNHLKSIESDIDYIARKLSWRLENQGLKVEVLLDLTIFETKEAPFRKLCTEHKYRLFTSLFYDTGNKIYDLTLSAKEAYVEIISKQDLLDKYKQHLLESDFKTIDSDFNALAKELYVKGLGIEYVYEISFRLYYLSLDVLNRLGCDSQILMFPEWRDFNHFETYNQWIERERQQLKSVYNMLIDIRESAQQTTYQDIMNYIHQHYHEPLSIKEIGQALHLNATYVGRVFKQQTGVSIKKYLNDLRIEEAKSLLLNSNKMIYEVASIVGFGESKYFVSRFTETVGVSPAQYRKNALSVSEE